MILSSLGLIIIIVLFVLVLASKGLKVVQQAEVIIVERLGRYHKTLSSGLHIIWPLSINPVLLTGVTSRKTSKVINTSNKRWLTEWI